MKLYWQTTVEGQRVTWATFREAVAELRTQRAFRIKPRWMYPWAFERLGEFNGY